MGLRQDRLKLCVEKKYKLLLHSKPTSVELLNSKYASTILKTYAALKGKLTEPPTRVGSWDISTDEFIIELDEERHFNRYRLITLKSDFYKSHSYFSVPEYQNYCKGYETICLKTACWGKNWKNDSTEKQFSKSDTEGQFISNGSSRWKQRAFYDFLKDVSSKLMAMPIIRISIYDLFKKISIDQLLKTNQEKILLEFIERRIKEDYSY